jgi:hypothetical protein
MIAELSRLARRAHPERVPRAVENEPGIFAVDATWGVIQPTVVFCNGPQCTATAQAIDALLAAGWPPERLLYYRGGIHDWVTLGLPLARPAS